MENINIYDDVSSVDLGNEIHKLEDQNRQLLQHIRKLETDIEKLCSELNNMKQIQQNLSKNISELYKTAKLEIQRKDKIISGLWEEIDGLKLRKGGIATSLRRELCEEEDRIYEQKAAKLEIQRKDRIISELREEIDSLKLRKGGIVTSLKRELWEEEEDRIYEQNDQKRFKNELLEENIFSVSDKRIYSSGRSTPDVSTDNSQFKHDNVNCKHDMDYKSGNDYRYNSRYPRQRIDSKRNNRYNPRDQYTNDRYRRGRSIERLNRSRSTDKYRRSRSSNKYRRSRSSNKFRRSRSSNKSDDIKENRHSKSREEASTSKSDIKSITIQEYRSRMKVISTVTTNEENNLKIEDNNKDAQSIDCNIPRDSVKNEHHFLDSTNKDIPYNNEHNNFMNQINNTTIKSSGTIDNISINTSICSNSSENTSFNASGTSNGLKTRRRRCVVIGIKEKV